MMHSKRPEAAKAERKKFVKSANGLDRGRKIFYALQINLFKRYV